MPIFWLVLLLAIGVVAFLAAWLGGYAGKRGQQFATRADMDELIQQTKRTTREVERIRSDISFTEWVAREHRTLRRTNLEELLHTAAETMTWVSGCQVRIFEEQGRNLWNTDITRSPVFRVATVTKLYFPELRAAEQAFETSQHTFFGWVVNGSSEMREARDVAGKAGLNQDEASLFVHDRLYAELSQIYTDLVQKFWSLQRSAATLMDSIATVRSEDPAEESRSRVTV